MANLKIPYSVEHVTPEWLTDVLRSRGVIKGATVTSFDTEILGVGQGFTGQIARLRLSYDSEEDGAPDSLIAKFPATDPTLRAGLNSLYANEMRCYEEVLRQVELSTPRRYYGASDQEAGDHVLLLEDLSDARAGDNVAGCTEEDAKLAVREIAKFHAAFWESRSLDDLDWIPCFDQDGEAIMERYTQMLDPFLAKVGDALPPTLLDVTKRLGGSLLGIRTQLGEPPRTVVHGDYRLDNMFFGTRGVSAPLTVIDWQVPLIGRGVADVAYFLGFSVDPEQRRDTETGLLEAYVSVLAEAGMGGYDFDQCRHDYRLSMLNHVSRLVIAVGLIDISSDRAGRFIAAAIERFDSALNDHNVVELMSA